MTTIDRNDIIIYVCESLIYVAMHKKCSRIYAFIQNIRFIRTFQESRRYFKCITIILWEELFEYEN